MSKSQFKVVLGATTFSVNASLILRVKFIIIHSPSWWKSEYFMLMFLNSNLLLTCFDADVWNMLGRHSAHCVNAVLLLAPKSKSVLDFWIPALWLYYMTQSILRYMPQTRLLWAHKIVFKSVAVALLPPPPLCFIGRMHTQFMGDWKRKKKRQSVWFFSSTTRIYTICVC